MKRSRVLAVPLALALLGAAPAAGGPATDPSAPDTSFRLRPPIPAGAMAERSVRRSATTPVRAPALGVSFDGLASADNQAVLDEQPIPPDPVIDVGPNHIVQMTNLVTAVYDKTGTLLLGPVANNTMFAGAGGLCESTNQGDPIVLYDPMADRWLLSQFAFNTDPQGNLLPPFSECIAISQTPDPTGEYFAYEFQVSATKFPDYPKLGVWPNGYFMTANQFNPFTGEYEGVGVWAFEREAMLAGDPAPRMVYEDLCQTFLDDTCLYYTMLPADLDGATEPPSGAPNPLAASIDGDIYGGADRIDIFEFDPNYDSPGSSTFAGPFSIPVERFDSTLCDGSFDCIPQPGTPRGLDAIPGVLMHRLAYRNLGDREVLLANQTADVGTNRAGILWYELSRTGDEWIRQQEGVISPNTTHRWLGSIAMDRSANIGVGYSAGGAATFPSIRYTGRDAADPSGQMQEEAILQEGGGSQTSEFFRWGDYSATVVDPADDCTFWHVNEYYPSTSERGWATRIGSFRFDSCGQPPPPPPPPPPPVGPCDVAGTAGRDVLIGTATGENLCGRGGNDLLRGLGGGDFMKGGTGRDRIRGGKGDDRMRGGGGNDAMNGGPGFDQAFGGPGNDRCRAEFSGSC